MYIVAWRGSPKHRFKTRSEALDFAYRIRESKKRLKAPINIWGPGPFDFVGQIYDDGHLYAPGPSGAVRRADENPIKRPWMLLGLLGAVGVGAYFLLRKPSETAPDVLPVSGGGTTPLPAPKTSSSDQAKQARIAAYQKARSAYETFVSYLQTNPPKTQVEIAAAQKKLQELHETYVAAGLAAGISAGDLIG